MQTTHRPNKYAGYCGCGAKVETDQGFYNYGATFCQAPNDLNYCPTEQARNEAQLQAAQQAAQQHWDSMTDAQRAQFGGDYTNHADGTCGKCKGTRIYVYANGTKGVCYQCDGKGTI